MFILQNPARAPASVKNPSRSLPLPQAPLIAFPLPEPAPVHALIIALNAIRS